MKRRTIFRDIKVLRYAGVPIEYDKKIQGYCIPGTYYLPSTNFTPEEALAMTVVCHELSAQMPAAFFGPARSASLKLESCLPRRVREQVQQAGPSVQIELLPTNPLEGKGAIYDHLLAATTHRRAVRIRYGSLAEGKVICCRLHPYRLYFSRRSWYVIGRSSVHRATRTFNLGRILELEVLEDSYEIPRGFSIDRYLRNAWHMIPERGPDQEVLVRFDKQVAQNVAEVAWHKTQRLEFRPDGSLDFRVTVSGLKEISWWILGYGDRAEVIEPVELRHLLATHAARMVQRYEDQFAEPRKQLKIAN